MVEDAGAERGPLCGVEGKNPLHTGIGSGQAPSHEFRFPPNCVWGIILSYVYTVQIEESQLLK